MLIFIGIRVIGTYITISEGSEVIGTYITKNTKKIVLSYLGYVLAHNAH